MDIFIYVVSVTAGMALYQLGKAFALQVFAAQTVAPCATPYPYP